MFKTNYLLLSATAIFSLCLGAGVCASLADDSLPPLSKQPQILSTVQIESNTSSQIQVTGLVYPGNKVLIYLNGKYNGIANISQLNEQFDQFIFLSSTVSTDQPYEVMAIAQSIETNLLSLPAEAQVKTQIELPTLKSEPSVQMLPSSPATTAYPPILRSPATSTCVSKLYISGDAENNSIVDIYVDGDRLTSIPLSGLSERSLFAYTPSIDLSRGRHLMFATSHAGRDSASLRSKTLSFCLISPMITSTSTENIVTASTSISEGTNPESDLVFQKTTSTATSANSHKNFINIAIFSVFIIGLIAWMVVVNRELKEDNQSAGPVQPNQLN